MKYPAAAKAIASLALLLISGCVGYSRPPNDVGFTKVVNLHQLEGCFLNSGEAGQGLAVAPLSHVIWPKEELNPERIALIKVEVEAESTLIITALGDGKPLKQDRFINGQDFKVEDGRIKVRSRLMGTALTQSGNPFIGIGKESRLVGVDKSGDARVQDSGAFAGTVFVVFPVIGHVREVTRYKRVACDGS